MGRGGGRSICVCVCVSLGQVLMDEISVIIKGTQENSLAFFLPWKGTTKRQQSETHKRALMRTQPYWDPDLRLL